MCGRTACTLAPDNICRACGRHEPDGKYSQPQWIDGPKGHSYSPSYNLAPTTFSPVMFSRKHLPADKLTATDSEDVSTASCGFVIQPMRWGLIPSWHRGEAASIEYKMNNARSDGLLSKASFKKPLERGNRCVVLADGYFEWQRRADGSKQPYFIYFPQRDTRVKGEEAAQVAKADEENNIKVKDEVSVDGANVDVKVKVQVIGEGIATEIKFEETGKTKVMPEKRLLTMAGLFDVWKSDEASEPLYSYTVITVDAHDKLAWMHDRMPAILNGEDEVDAWLNYEDVKLTEALKLIRPTDTVVCHAVSSTVNNSRNNSADCVKHFQSEAAEQKKSSASANLMKSWLGSAAKRSASDDGSSVDKKPKI